MSLALLGFLVCGSIGVGSEAQSKPGAARLHYDVTPQGHVRLRWLVREWPNGMRGFCVFRQALAKDGTKGRWSRVGPEVLAPCLEKEHLKRLGLNKVLRAVEKSERKEPVSTAYMVKDYATKPEVLKKARIVSANEFEYAVAFGFGWIDRDAPLGKRCEYVLARVIGDGPASPDKPAASVTTDIRCGDFAMPRLRSAKAWRTGQTGVVSVDWDINVDDLKTCLTSCAAFIVLKRTTSGSWKSIGARSPRLAPVTKKIAKFSAGDLAAGEAPHCYALAPQNFFGRIGRKTLLVAPAAKAADFGKVTSVTAGPFDGNYMIRWSYRQPPDAPVLGFKVVRQDGNTRKKVVLADNVPLTRRSFIDRTAVKSARGYRVIYHVSPVVAGAGPLTRVPSGEVEVYTYPPGEVVAPRLKKVELIEKKDKFFVRCRVEPGNDTRIRAYDFSLRPDGMRQWFTETSFDPDKNMGLSCEFEITRKSITFGKGWLRCRAIDCRSKHGPPSAPVWIELPDDKNATVPGSWGAPTAIAERDGLVRVTWKGLGASGYRLFANGVPVALEAELGAGASCWESRTLPPGKYRFSLAGVSAAGELGELKPGNEITVYGRRK